MTVAVLIEGLRKGYGGTTAVDGVDLVVEQGEIFGILGPNGSGKTTTVECAYGLRKADAGRTLIFGLDAQSDPGGAGRLVGAQLQHSALPERIRVDEAVHLFATLAGRGIDEARQLEEWGLAGKRRASYGSLSGGQRQRLHVALALLGRPRLVVLDEMTTGLDPNARREAWELVEQVRRDGTTVVLVTHFMDEAQRLCDRLAVLTRGRVAAQGTPGDLVHAHGGGTRVSFAVDERTQLPDLGRVPGVVDVSRHDGRVSLHGGGAMLVGLGHALAGAGLAEVELDVAQPSLEDAYLRLVSGTED